MDIPASLIDDAAAELRSLITLRSRTSIRDRPFPTLATLAQGQNHPTDRDARYLSLTTFIDRGIGEIVDTSHRRAAEHLVGSGPGRWRTVAQRGADAAAEFGCGWDAYRRRRANGSSQLDDTLTALAQSLVRIADSSADLVASGLSPSRSIAQEPGSSQSAAPAVAPVSLGPSPTISEPHPREDQRVPHRPRRLHWAAAALSLLIVAGGILWVRDSPSGPRPAGPDTDAAECIGLTHSVGDVPENADVELRIWGDRFAQAARKMEDPPRCAGYVLRRDGLILQPYGVTLRRGTGVGAFVSVLAPAPQVVILTHAQYAQYRAMAESYGPERLGDPVKRNDTGRWQVAEFTNGTIIGPAVDAPAFSIVGATRERFLATGGLDGTMGAPTTFPYDVAGSGRVQEFAKGKLVTTYLDGSLQWDPVKDPAADLPDRTSNVVLSSADKTSWFVDDSHVRHWLPTGADYKCAIGGLGVGVYDGTPSWAIATLEVGDAFTCR